MRGRIREAVLVVVALVALLTLCGVPRAYPQDPTKPCGLAFECAQDVRFKNAVMSWELTADVVTRPALYDFARWRIVYTSGPDAGVPQEFTATMSFPSGGPMQYRIERLEHVRWWRTLWLTKVPRWRALKRGTPEYRAAIQMMMRLFGVANLLRHEVDPATLSF